MIETVPSGTILHGHYRIERVLGSGGFGHVYLAIDLHTNQQFAVKEYLVTGASGQEQLKHEAAVLSQLHHPSLPAFQDAFIERGRYYVVLNYIEGNDLTDLIRTAKQRNDVVPIGRIMQWLLSICDAVMFLHGQHPPVIHRDIKPDNIRITPSGTAILVDLGNAKAAADGARTLFFIRHQGTPGYAPPEQYPGGSGTDVRSDVYALGGTLFYALTAHEPPSVSTRNQAIQQGLPDMHTLQEQLANNPPEESPEAQAAKQFRLGVTKPSKPAPRHSRHLAQLGTIPPKVLEQLNKIIYRSMAMKPKDRYQSVADFANDLRKVVNAMPSATTPPSTPKRTPDPNSTQPDLPMLYDAIQAAKENDTQGPLNATPVHQQDSTALCPRCNSVVNAKASFCNRCGNSLTPHAQQQKAQAVKVNDPGDQTMLYRQQPGQQQQMVYQHKAAPQKPATSATGQGSGQYPHAGAQVQHIRSGAPTATRTPPPSSPIPPDSPLPAQSVIQRSATSSTNNGGSSIISRLSSEPKVIIFLLIVLVLLITIALFLLSNGNVHAHPQTSTLLQGHW